MASWNIHQLFAWLFPLKPPFIWDSSLPRLTTGGYLRFLLDNQVINIYMVFSCIKIFIFHHIPSRSMALNISPLYTSFGTHKNLRHWPNPKRLWFNIPFIAILTCYRLPCFWANDLIPKSESDFWNFEDDSPTHHIPLLSMFSKPHIVPDVFFRVATQSFWQPRMKATTSSKCDAVLSWSHLWASVDGCEILHQAG